MGHEGSPEALRYADSFFFLLGGQKENDVPVGGFADVGPKGIGWSRSLGDLVENVTQSRVSQDAVVRNIGRPVTSWCFGRESQDSLRKADLGARDRGEGEVTG